MLHQLLNFNRLKAFNALFYVVNVSNVLLLFVDAFDELTGKIMQFISNIQYVSVILCLLCKFNGNI